jgi:hypothetical protein
MRPPVVFTVLPAVMAMYLPFCAAEIRPVLHPADGPRATLWAPPADLEERDLFHGPWGPDNAPDPDTTYTLVHYKHSGVNPGMTVRDAGGREWSVKQAPSGEPPDEGPIEVVLSRVLSAVGYPQPPIYYLRAFSFEDDWGTHVEPGGRFRLKTPALEELDTWSWQQNPFVGTEAYQGLLVILMMFNASDLKNGNNTVYEHRSSEAAERWYVVRDIGTALGTTGRLAPRKGDPDAFERHGYITGVRNGFVRFDYRGWHQELVRDRITPEDVRWASRLLDRLSERQWQDAFRAGGYSPDVAARFVRTLRQKVDQGLHIAGDIDFTTD